MDLSKIMAITGKSGLFQLAGQRNNGVIVKSLKDDKKQFISARSHIFSLLDNISIYTLDDSTPLHDIFQTIFKQEEAGSLTLPSNKASSNELKDFLRSVLPDYDEERVYVSDIKKLIKWYGELKANNLVDLEPKPENEDNKDTEAEVKEETEA